jgi:hypothetical protein
MGSGRKKGTASDSKYATISKMSSGQQNSKFSRSHKYTCLLIHLQSDIFARRMSQTYAVPHVIQEGCGTTRDVGSRSGVTEKNANHHIVELPSRTLNAFNISLNPTSGLLLMI